MQNQITLPCRKRLNSSVTSRNLLFSKCLKLRAMETLQFSRLQLNTLKITPVSMALRMKAKAALPCQLICSTTALSQEMVFFVFFILYSNTGYVLQKEPYPASSLDCEFSIVSAFTYLLYPCYLKSFLSGGYLRKQQAGLSE